MHLLMVERWRCRASTVLFLATVASAATRAYALPDYPSALVFSTDCTNKCIAGRTAAVQYVILGVAESQWDAAVATYQFDPGKSVHYIVGADGRVGQFIAEGDTPFFAGNAYYNPRAVTITLEGFVSAPAFPEAEYQAAAALVGDVLARHQLTPDRVHVLGLDQIPNGNVIPEDSAPCGDGPATCEQSANYGGAANNRTPGLHFDWCGFLHRLGGTCACADVGAALTCSSDRTAAFRCANGTVEMQTCDGAGACEPGSGGADAVCHMVSTTTTTTLPGSAACAGFDGMDALQCLRDHGLAATTCQIPPALSSAYDRALTTMGAALARGPGRKGRNLARIAIARFAAVKHRAKQSRAVKHLSPSCRATVLASATDALARAKALAAGLGG